VKQGLIFDLDGTLVDSLPGIAASLNHALGSLGLPPHIPADVRTFIGDGSWILAQRAAPAGSPDATVDAIEKAFKIHYDLNWAAGTAPYPGISQMLKSLAERGHPLAVLSNKPHPFTAAIVQALFPEISFAIIVGQKPGIPHKPDPTGALEIIRAFGQPAEICTLIGDSTIDLETARNAGLQSIAVTWGYHDRTPLADAGPGHLIEEPGALLDLLD
jgi:phosphoglycolate phosphatase